MGKKRSKTYLILRALSIPRSVEELSRIFPGINKRTISVFLSLKVREGILAKSDTNPRKYVLNYNKKLFRSKNIHTLPTVHERIGSLKKHMPEEFTATDFAVHWWEQGYDYDTIKDSFDYIVSVLKNKNEILKVDKNLWRLTKGLGAKTRIHKKVDNKVLCGYKTNFPIELKVTEDDDQVTCKRCVRDMILKLTGDRGRSQKKKWMQDDINILKNRLKKLKKLTG